MKKFWEQSPEWQRMQEFDEAFDKARQVDYAAGEAVLARVLIEGTAPDSPEWRHRCAAYNDAFEASRAASRAWTEARRAYKASPAGKAEARYYKDPLVSRAAESEVAA